jgi:hypothetical protein
MSDQVNIGFSPATAWNRIQIGADRATAAAEFKTAKTAFATAAFTLLGAWENVEMCGSEVQIEGYPFPKSFDEVVRSIQDWAEKESVAFSPEAG